jgi:hypothetical protein
VTSSISRQRGSGGSEKEYSEMTTEGAELGMEKEK